MTAEPQSTIDKGRGAVLFMASVALALAAAINRLSHRFRSLGAELNLA